MSLITPADTVVIKWFRIALASTCLLSVLLFGPYVTQFFSSDGYINASQMMSIKSSGGGGNSFSLFFFNDTKLFVNFCYILMIGCLVSLLLGYRPALSALLSWVFYLSFYNRFTPIGYGGSEILIMTLFLCAIIHQWPYQWSVRLVQINFAIIYLFAAITKLTHASWMNGTELAATINSNYGVFNYGWMGEYAGLTALFVYLATITEVIYPALIWFEATRGWVLLFTLGLNIGIIFTLQVTFFPHSMLVGSILFLKHNDFSRLSIYIKDIYLTALTHMKDYKRIILSLIILCLVCIAGYQVGYPYWYSYMHQGCKPGFVKVSANPARNIEKDFCVMKYEAKKDPIAPDDSANALSTPYYSPWTMITLEQAKQACKRAGLQLITNDQWMTIADRITRLPINDISPEPGVQLASGNSSGVGRALGARFIDDPVIWKCNLDLPLSHYENRYRGNLCELRGERANLFTHKGYFGTDRNFDMFSGTFTAGALDRSHLRTFVIEKNSVIWDFAGNAWEWTDSKLFFEPTTGQSMGVGSDSGGLTGELPKPETKITTTFFHDYHTITNWGSASDLEPPSELSTINGIGKIYLNPGPSWGATTDDEKNIKALVRGGAWGNPAESGVYSLNISHAPSNKAPYLGFRCTYVLE